MGFFYFSIRFLVLCALFLVAHGRVHSFRPRSLASLRTAISNEEKQNWKEADAICRQLASAILDEEKLQKLSNANLALLPEEAQESSRGSSLSAIQCYLGDSRESNLVLSGKAVKELPCMPNCSERPYIILRDDEPSAIHPTASTNIPEENRRGVPWTKQHVIAAVVYVNTTAKNEAQIIREARKKLELKTGRKRGFRQVFMDRLSATVKRVGPHRYRVIFIFKTNSLEPEITPTSMYT